MPTDDQQLFPLVEWAVRRELSGPVLVFLRLRNLEERWSAATGNERIAVVEEACDLVKDLIASGVLPETGSKVSIDSPGEDEGDADPRWHVWERLLGKLGRRDRRADTSSWSPLVLTRVFDLTHLPLVNQRVEISIDSRLSLRRLKRALDRAWPRLVSEGWVRSARPIGQRGAELLAHVCLSESPGDTWRERMDTWNAAHPDAAHQDVRAFVSAFRRAEKQLTGREYGLAWFYDPDIHEAQWVTKHLSAEAASGLSLQWSLQGVPRNRLRVRMAQLAGQGEVGWQLHRHRAWHAVQAIGQTAAFDEYDADEEIEDYLEDEGLSEKDLPDDSLGDWRVEE